MFSFLQKFMSSFHIAGRLPKSVPFLHFGKGATESGQHTPSYRSLILKHFSRTALPVLFPVLLAFLICRLVTSPPDFLLSEEQRFSNFTEEVFRNELSGNTLNLHYTIANPADYGIDASNVSLGKADLQSRKAACAATENYFSTLKNFDRNKLSAKQQLTYDVFYNYLETELSASDLLLYDEPLSPTLGVQAQLPILLAEYSFRTRGDIEDYLCLLTQIPDYFSSILAFEREKSAAGLFMSEDNTLAVMQQCQEFIADAENNYLLTIFDEKIDQIANLTVDEKIAYKTRSKSILQGYVIPAYQELIDGIGALCDTGQNDKGLYFLPQGQEYYRYLIRSMVGDDREITEIEEEIKNQMVEDYAAVQELLAQYKEQAAKTSASVPEKSVQESNTESTAAADSVVSTQNPFFTSAVSIPFSGFDLVTLTQNISSQTDTQNSDSAALLEQLRQKITNDFPLLPSVSCDIKYVHKSLQEHLSPAFYLTPAIDDYENNVIYINPASNYDELDLFTTLAHEGYPGHLYQTVYFHATEPDLLRTILDTGGYVEGWATYVEMYSYSLWEKDPTLAALGQHNRSFTLGLASLLDIGIHYRGYSLEDVTSFLARLGFERETAASLYQSILQAPANYLQYYVGYLNFKRLCTEQQQKLGTNFSLKEFHRAILDVGPVPFYLLNEYLEAGNE